MTKKIINIRNANPAEFKEIGYLMVEVYSKLEGFPTHKEQPEYYELLLNIGDLTKRPKTELIVAVSDEEEVMGALVYFSDMSYYGSGGTATKEKNASGFRLLAVDPDYRGIGIGKQLTIACIEKAKNDQNEQLIIHSTRYMKVAWIMYENLGFKRSEDLDFMQGQLPVYGFRLKL
ncbi:GNAT family N-acetyltransferase [Christiangramia echinicola]|uniref:Acetyltransferase (GNAT) domain-containing protein n=1 Tax=Christiangramia echinicola TaxID=279359 RepID=A0A1H1KVH4_9FLAO|nr:GNAT family N-acetyltransferase [Christiangramia echinicola]SDR66358.1 Acetyltransferase (GNAT) domain-containing protein [Christiangramia echinicola]